MHRLRQNAREHTTILHDKTQARGRLGAVRQHAPDAVGPAREVGGVELQVVVAGHAHRLARAQVNGIGEDQRGRDEAISNEAMDAVEIAEDQVEQARPLDEASRQFPPFFGGKDEGDEIQVPRLVALTAGAGRETTNPVLAQNAAAVLDAQDKFFPPLTHRATPSTPASAGAPGRMLCAAHPKRGRQPHHERAVRLVPGPFQQRSRKANSQAHPGLATGDSSFAAAVFPWRTFHATVRKSSVNGESGLLSTKRGVIGPGV